MPRWNYVRNECIHSLTLAATGRARLQLRERLGSTTSGRIDARYVSPLAGARSHRNCSQLQERLAAAGTGRSHRSASESRELLELWRMA